MPLIAYRHARLDQPVYSARPHNPVWSSLIIILLVAFAGACGDSTSTNKNSTANSNQRSDSNANLNPGTVASSGQYSAVDIKEPERYGIAMTMSLQDTGSASPAPMLTQQFDFIRFDADRRWTFTLPAPLGQIAYLEKSGLRYLVLFDRKQYTEVNPGAFGFEPNRVLIPTSIAERFRSHQYEKLGLEPVNGRTAIKYRLSISTDALTHMLYVDQETGLPLRSEMNAQAAGAKYRTIIEVRGVQLNPDRTQFDVPLGLKKVSQQDAQQQIDGFANALRPFADIISGNPPALPVSVITLPGNKNGNRR